MRESERVWLEDYARDSDDEEVAGYACAGAVGDAMMGGRLTSEQGIRAPGPDRPSLHIFVRDAPTNPSPWIDNSGPHFQTLY